MTVGALGEKMVSKTNIDYEYQRYNLKRRLRQDDVVSATLFF